MGTREAGTRSMKDVQSHVERNWMLALALTSRLALDLAVNKYLILVPSRSRPVFEVIRSIVV